MNALNLGSEFSTELGAEFHVIPSKPGPYSISGTYEDLEPDCYDPIFCNCFMDLASLTSQLVFMINQILEFLALIPLTQI